MNQLERIMHMEAIMDEAAAAIEQLSAALESCAGVEEKLRELEEYYESPQWMHDFETDSAGELPGDLKRGVLSEDGVYNLLTDYSELLKAMQTFVEENGHD